MVEHHVANVDVAGSNPVSRSLFMDVWNPRQIVAATGFFDRRKLGIATLLRCKLSCEADLTEYFAR